MEVFWNDGEGVGRNRAENRLNGTHIPPTKVCWASAMFQGCDGEKIRMSALLYLELRSNPYLAPCLCDLGNILHFQAFHFILFKDTCTHACMHTHTHTHIHTLLSAQNHRITVTGKIIYWKTMLFFMGWSLYAWMPSHVTHAWLLQCYGL